MMAEVIRRPLALFVCFVSEEATVLQYRKVEVGLELEADLKWEQGR
jgi:hypothetical protein